MLSHVPSHILNNLLRFIFLVRFSLLQGVLVLCSFLNFDLLAVDVSVLIFNNFLFVADEFKSRNFLLLDHFSHFLDPSFGKGVALSVEIHTHTLLFELLVCVHASVYEVVFQLSYKLCRRGLLRDFSGRSFWP